MGQDAAVGVALLRTTRDGFVYGQIILVTVILLILGAN